MSAVAAPTERARWRGHIVLPMLVAISFRNLWRNRRRTWLSALAIGFAVMLLAVFMAVQTGSYATMIDSATSLLHGHLQVQAVGYADEPRVSLTIDGAEALAERLRELPGIVAVGRRAEAFVLASSGARSFAAQLIGVEPRAEASISTLSSSLVQGRYIERADEAVMGVALARNLRAELGEEIVLLGSGKEGGVAALVVRCVGLFETGQAEIDRAVVQVPLQAFADAFGLGDEAHVLVLRARSVERTEELVASAQRVTGGDLAVLGWRELLPELEQMIDLDRISARFMYGLLALMVTFSIVNTFIMTVFERTREFGVLMALGMRRSSLIGLLQIEALWLVLLGVVVGVGVAALVLWWAGSVGIPIGGAEDIFRGLHLPGRIFPVVDVRALTLGPLIMAIAVQLAALLPSLRLRRLTPVMALRAT